MLNKCSKNSLNDYRTNTPTSNVIMLNNCNMKSRFIFKYGNSSHLNFPCEPELILVVDFDSESMGLAVKIITEAKDGKVCFSPILLLLQDLQYVLFIQSVFRNLSNEISLICFVQLI